jgi:hypothetical protein
MEIPGPKPGYRETVRAYALAGLPEVFAEVLAESISIIV